MKHPDILIIGGGVSGLFSAITLADAGLKVQLLERGERAAESSWAGAGILSALPPWGYGPAVGDLARHRLEVERLVVVERRRQNRQDAAKARVGGGQGHGSP